MSAIAAFIVITSLTLLLVTLVPWLVRTVMRIQSGGIPLNPTDHPAGTIFLNGCYGEMRKSLILEWTRGGMVRIAFWFNRRVARPKRGRC